MTTRNTLTSYGWPAKAFHWSIGLLIIGLLAVGLYMEDLPKDAALKWPLYDAHKATGILVLVLAVLRMAWRWINLAPTLAETTPRWQIWAADIAHALLYAAMILMPLTGWLMSSAGGHPISFYGLFTVPPLVAPDKEMGHFYNETHEFIGWVLIWVIGVHVAAALKHHIIDKDTVLRRMLPSCNRCQK